MTKKDYQLLAGRIKAEIEYHNIYVGDAKLEAHALSCTIGIEGLALSLAEDLARDNPRFDADKFLDACGIGNQ